MKDISNQHELSTKLHDLEEEETNKVEQSTYQMFMQRIKEVLLCKDREELHDEDELNEENSKVNNQKLSYFRSARLRKFEDEYNELMNLRQKWILK